MSILLKINGEAFCFVSRTYVMDNDDGDYALVNGQ